MIIYHGVANGYYYVDGIRTAAGLVEQDGYYYFANTGGKLVVDQPYWVSKTNGLVSTGTYRFDAEGKILNINVLEQKETPGLGTKMADEGNVLLLSLKDKNAAEVNMTVKKDGGDIDALTAATISSRAYAEAVAVAYEAYKVASGKQSEAGDVATGATKQEGGKYE